MYEGSRFNNRNRIYDFVGHRLCYLFDFARNEQSRQYSGINDGGDSVGNFMFFVVRADGCFGDFRYQGAEKTGLSFENQSRRKNEEK